MTGLQDGEIIILRYDTIEEFNVDSKAEYSAKISTIGFYLAVLA